MYFLFSVKQKSKINSEKSLISNNPYLPLRLVFSGKTSHTKVIYPYDKRGRV